MLVLTRKLNQSILLGDGIEVKIVAIRGSGDQAVIRLGVVAPKEVSVLRKELYEEVVAANREAAAPKGVEISLLHQALQPKPDK